MRENTRRVLGILVALGLAAALATCGSDETGSGSAADGGSDLPVLLGSDGGSKLPDPGAASADTLPDPGTTPPLDTGGGTDTGAPDAPATPDHGTPAKDHGSKSDGGGFSYPCEPGTVELCQSHCGSIGKRQCLKDWGPCLPPDEICGNCADDNCDGNVDEGCTPNPKCGPAEPCDCIDNDNDGYVDEDCNPKPVCDKEPCDCIDNDGDGKLDEGCPWWWWCDPEQECDCIDNDNDGQIDESCDPLPTTCPGEVCDCKDNDGDGQIDEDCDCIPGTERWCDDPVYCSWGKQTCLPNGQWAACKETNGAPSGCDDTFGGDVAYYDTDCCVQAGECCQNYPAKDSVGSCTKWTCGTP